MRLVLRVVVLEVLHAGEDRGRGEVEALVARVVDVLSSLNELDVLLAI